MPLQSSGAISIDDIRTELGSSSGSLRTLSAAAGKSTPDAISEFYGYSSGPPDLYGAVAYTGDNTTSRSFTSIGFKPDLFWSKPRNGFGAHLIADAIRGTTKYIYPDRQDTELTITNALQSFDTNGFTVSNNTNVNGNSSNTYVVWCWKAGNGTSTNTSGSVNSTVSVNSAGGFSIIQFTAPSTAGNFSVGHGLSSAPDFVIFRSPGYYSTTAVYSSTFSSATDWISLDYTNAVNTSLPGSSPMSSAPTSSILNLQCTTYGPIKTTEPTIAYAFHNVSGVSSHGTYTGNGTTQSITTGFQPSWIMLKATSGAGDWPIFDSERGFSCWLTAEDTNPETCVTAVSVNSTGFDLTSGFSQTNRNGRDFMYLAFV